VGKSKVETVKTPFQQQQVQQNTFAPIGIAGTKEAQDFLDVPLDFGSEVDVDPGVGRRTDLAEQDVNDRYNSAFNAGVPEFIREANRAKELRAVRGQGSAEAQAAKYANQQGNNALRAQKTAAELERRRMLLPQIFQTGGSGTSSGYNSQAFQQPSIWQSIIGGAAQVGSAAIGKLPYI
jgi:hypothetical protein